VSDVAAATAALWAGRPVIIPTDTVYGLAARAADADAVAALFALKGRPVDTAIAVLVADAGQAGEFVDATVPAYRPLVERYWPGPLTVVAPRIDGGALAAGDATTLGVRCPDDDLVRALAAEVGPIAATSANRHGETTPTTAAAVAARFPEIAVVLDGGARPGAASTVVTVCTEPPSVLREGPIPAAEIEAAARSEP
jgi:L-threonylcarbamoyladenylate synthase